MPRHIAHRSADVEAPSEGAASTASTAAVTTVAAGTLRVAQREVSRVIHAALYSCNQIRASEHIKGMFRCGK